MKLFSVGEFLPYLQAENINYKVKFKNVDGKFVIVVSC